MKNVTKWSMMMLMMIAPLMLACGSGDGDSDGDLPGGNIAETYKNLEIIESSINSFYQQSQNFEEFSAHINEFESLEGVEKAWKEDSTLFIKVENGGTVIWTFNQEEDDWLDFSRLCQVITENGTHSITRSESDDEDLCENTHVLVLNQQSNDIGRDIYKSNYKGIQERIKEIPEYTSFDYKEADDFTLDFLRNDLSNYGVIFMITHGIYCQSRYNNLHWIVTGELAPSNLGSLRKWWAAWYYNRIAIVHIKEKRINVLNGSVSEYIVPYLCFSEEFIKNEMKTFSKNSILFNTACQSLKGNDNVWEAFKSKGLGCYLGYTNDNAKGKEAGCVFIENMFLSSQTVETTSKSLYSNFQLDGAAVLKCCPSNSPIRISKGINPCPDANHPHMIDLGLPSGTKWACCNIGATRPEEYGDYYTWGGLKKVYEGASFDEDEDEDDDMPTDISGTKYDIAKYLKLGRMPDFDSFYELDEECTHEYIELNGVAGTLYAAKNGSRLFFPHAGDYFGYEDTGYYLSGAGVSGLYWTSKRYPYESNCAYCWWFKYNLAIWEDTPMWIGCSVRPVSN